MSKHDLKAEKLQVKTLDNKVLAFIEALVSIRMASDEIDLSHPLSLVTKAYVDSVTGDGIPRIAPWDGGSTPRDYYRTIFVGDIEYEFRSLIDGNTSEPTLTGGGETAWEDSGETGFPAEYLNLTTYPSGRIVWEYDPDFPGDPTKLVTFRSLQAGNLGNPLDFDGDTAWWEKLGAYKSPFVYVSGTTYGLKEVVIDDTDGDKIYISKIADNDFALDYIIPGSALWQLIGPIAGSGGGTPTTGTIAALDSPLVITWDTDIVPDDEEGRTYFEKHGALEYVTIQMTMPDPANEGENTVFPSWRFDEATKNILTIDNQGQKVYYTIGFGANGPSTSGTSITLTTEGTSGPATLEDGVLNIPEYTGDGSGLELGETSTTAYRGDRGKTAYDYAVAHDQVDNTSDADKPVSTDQATAIAGKEPSITAGTTDQLWIGNKTWASIITTVLGVVLTGLSTATSTAVIATDTILVAIGKLQAQINLKANIAATIGSSTALTFASESIQGSVDTPLTGNITGVTTSAVVGVVVHVVHNSGSTPTFDSKFKKASGSGNYVTGTINHIYCEYMSSTYIIYSITQAT